jgi:hypothetical protein
MRALRCTIVVAVAALGLLLPAPAQARGNVSCHMSFTLEGWSFLYKQSTGSGHVRCSNGQVADVQLRTYGGGATFGKSRIEGHGDFSGVRDIDDIFGTYFNAEAHAGAVKSTHATGMTKGEVSLGLTGTGDGWDIGIAFGGFIIER